MNLKTLTLVACLLGCAAGSARSQTPGTAENPTTPADHPPFLSHARQLTLEGARSGEGYFSADGKKLVFQSEREPGNPFFQIYYLNLENGGIQRISTGTGKTTCAWIHPSGDRVLFASTHEDPDAAAKQKQELADRAAGKQKRYEWDYDEHYELYARDLASPAMTRLTGSLGYDAEGSYSPDGKKIVFASNRHAYTHPPTGEAGERFERDPSAEIDIYIMDADGNPDSVRRLTDAPGYDGGPFFSPDGGRICWRRFSLDGATSEVYTMYVDGTDQRQVTRLGAMSWAPFYHPTGQYLVFTTNLHGFDNFELYLVDADGLHEPVRVTDLPKFDGLPAFSPDGMKLVWTSNRTESKKGQLFIADWDHGAALRALVERKESSVAARAAESDAATAAPAPVVWHDAVHIDDLRAHVARLAGEEFEGRLTGTEGERLATQYAADLSESYGLEPAGDDGTYFQSFPLYSGIELGANNTLTVTAGEPGAADAATVVGKDWMPHAMSRVGPVAPANIVFAGYGIVAPPGTEKGQEAYDSYAHLDVKGKWVMVLRSVPNDVTPERRQHLTRYAQLRHKAMVARDKGAVGVLFVRGPRSSVREQIVPLRFEGASAESAVAAVTITDKLAAALLPDLKQCQEELNKGEPAMGFALPEATKLGANIDLKLELSSGRNVIARLNAGDKPGPTAVLVGAHIDHLGRGPNPSSLGGRGVAPEAIHYGADDNASGTATILEIAQQLASLKREGKLPLKHDVLFAAWSGEEEGLVGSKHFVERLMDKDRKVHWIIANVNFDMVGRMPEKLAVHGIGSSTAWKGIVERANVPVGLPIQLVDDCFLPTDSTAFYMAGVPAISPFTNTHEDYHRPSDTPEKLNYEAMEKIARLGALIVSELATSEGRPDYVAQNAPTPGAQRAGMGVYLGTIPDYAQEPAIKGVKLSGVGKGGPAEKAGVKAGDLVVELAGIKVDNVNEYTEAFGSLKVGQETTIVVMREGKRVELKITPGSRD